MAKTYSNRTRDKQEVKAITDQKVYSFSNGMSSPVIRYYGN